MIGEFYDTINSLRDRQEVRLFFKSLLTGDEIATLMRRIEVAVLLSARFSYDQIKEILGVGNGKITSVHKALLQDDSGYAIVVKRLIENRKAIIKKTKKEEKTAQDSLGIIKKKYAGYFLLNNLLDVAMDKLSEDQKELEKEAILFTPSSTIFKKVDK